MHLDSFSATSGPEPMASRGLARRICAPIGQAILDLVFVGVKKIIALAPTESAPARTSGAPLRYRPISRAATSSVASTSALPCIRVARLATNFFEGVHVLLQLPEHQAGSVTQQIAQIEPGFTDWLLMRSRRSYDSRAQIRLAGPGDTAVFCAQDLVSFATAREGVTGLGFFSFLACFSRAR